VTPHGPDSLADAVLPLIRTRAELSVVASASRRSSTGPGFRSTGVSEWLDGQ